MDVDDRQRGSDVVVQVPRHRRGEQHVVVEEPIAHRASDRHRAEATVDDELCTSDEPSLVACEQHDRAGEIVRVAEAPERGVLEDRGTTIRL